MKEKMFAFGASVGKGRHNLMRLAVLLVILAGGVFSLMAGSATAQDPFPSDPAIYAVITPSAQVIQPGGTATITILFAWYYSHPGVTAAATGTIDWADGSTSQFATTIPGTPTVTSGPDSGSVGPLPHSYSNSGSYTILVSYNYTLSDGKSGSGSATAQVYVGPSSVTKLVGDTADRAIAIAAAIASGLARLESANLPSGELAWLIYPSDANESPDPLGTFVTTGIAFTPTDATRKGQTFAFIQVVLSSTFGGTALYPGNAAYFMQYSTDVNIANFLDHLEGELAPYYNGKWDDVNNIWVDSNERNHLGSLGNDGVTRKPATMVDTPGLLAGGRAGKTLIMRFETVIFCIDTQEVLGSLKWGLIVPANATDATTISEGKKTDCTAQASDSFKALVKKANDAYDANGLAAPVMTHAKLNGSAKVSSPTNGGNSALP